MKLFVYEHITSGALIDHAFPASLAKEGDDMLMAILQDCLAIETLELTILRDSRLSTMPEIDYDTLHCHHVSTSNQYIQLWQQCLINADAVFIIAPETGNVLYQLQQQAVKLNEQVLGCQPQAIKICSDKYHCDQHLKSKGHLTAHSCRASEWLSSSFDLLDGYIVKPIDGAGCIDTLYFERRIQLEQYLAQHDNVTLQSSMVQAYVKGETLSLSLLLDNDDALVLSINKQTINRTANTLSFTATTINDRASNHFSLAQAKNLARQLQHTISGLWGFVGVDFILSEEGPIIVDINPRLTTSYIGLKQSLGLNPFALLLNLSEQGIQGLSPILQRQHVEIKL